MKKTKTRFICDNCGHEELKWAGKCPECFSWNSFSEKTISSSGKINSSVKTDAEPALKLSEIACSDSGPADSGISEINRVLGGGITEGSVVLTGGEPGIGKSTIMLQLSNAVSKKEKVLYVTGEESPKQIKSRALRLGIKENLNLLFFFSTDLSDIMEIITVEKPAVVIIDSIQTLYSGEAGSAPGTVTQIKYCCQELVNSNKKTNSALFLVAHVTKEGSIAGPKVIEHMVDTVLYFEHTEDDMRILRSVKNRFGSVDELGLFRMKSTGLEEINSPENAFLVSRKGENPPGICIAPIHEGSRIFLVEIQALTVPAKGGFSRVFSDRIDSPRISRIAAVLEKHTGVRFSDQDIYVNVAGGMRVKEVGVDLPAALAIYSARTGVPLQLNTAAAGELSLTGEIRPVPFLDKRIKSLESFGIKQFVGAGGNTGSESRNSKITAVNHIKDIINGVFSLSNSKKQAEK